MPARADITQYLVHFVSAESKPKAFQTLWAIINEKRLLGTARLIRGRYPCICFTETPLELIRDTLLEAERTGHRYMPYGIAVLKAWLFDQGGRPVIYGPREEFDQLPKEMQWRHMRYEPTATPPVDFLWEREWRVNAEALTIYPWQAALIVPDHFAEQELHSRHDRSERIRYDGEELAYGEYAKPPEPFPWVVHSLSV
jgi:hypothetical protein